MTTVGITKNWSHVVLVYETGYTKEERIVHLAWHLSLVDEIKPPDYEATHYSLAPHVHPRVPRQLAAMVRLIIENNEQIPYAFSNPDGAFDPEGFFVDDIMHLGLTCATFVLAIFSIVGAPLALADTWENEPDDIIHIKRLLEILENGAPGYPPVSAEHLDKLRNNNQIRIRPLDVAGCCLVDLIPADFRTARTMGEVYRANK